MFRRRANQRIERKVNDVVNLLENPPAQFSVDQHSADAEEIDLPAAGPLPEMLAENVAKDLVRVFKVLSDATRLRIIYFLLQADEMHVRAICELLGQSQPAVSHHLALIARGGLDRFAAAGEAQFLPPAAGRISSTPRAGLFDRSARLAAHAIRRAYPSRGVSGRGVTEESSNHRVTEDTEKRGSVRRDETKVVKHIAFRLDLLCPVFSVTRWLA